MGSNCCAERDKPRDSLKPTVKEEPPAAGFVTKKPKEVLLQVLMIASDLEILEGLLKMLGTKYQTEQKEKSTVVFCEEWTFEITVTASTDSARLVTLGKHAKVVFFFFDLQSKRALEAAHATATLFKAQSRSDSTKHLIGYNSAHSTEVADLAGEFAQDLQFLYGEIPYPRDSVNSLVEMMKMKA